jgi:selenocysteine lyase/cysteine desulfurase
MSIAELDSALFTKYKIHTTPVVWEKIQVVRVTPHVYTSIKDVQKLVKALQDLGGRKTV